MSRGAARSERGDDGLDRLVAVFERVPALGDRQGENRKRRIGRPLGEQREVAGREHVVDDAADDARPRAIAVALDERVEVILRAQDIRHTAVTVEDADPADTPVTPAARDVVRVERHVRTMKASDAEVEDARDEGGPVEARHRHTERRDRGEGALGELRRHRPVRA